RYSPVQSPSSIPITASNVDFPAPDGPMIVTKSPAATSSVIRRSTNSRPSAWGKDFSRFERLIMGAGCRASGARYLRPDAKASEPSPVAADTRHQGPDTYSFLSATIGSTCVARRAGTYAAPQPTATSSTQTAASVMGSVGLTWKSSAVRNRELTSTAAR